MSPKRTAACVSPDRPSKSKHNSLTIRSDATDVKTSPKKKQEPRHRTSKPSTPSALPQQKPPVCVCVRAHLPYRGPMDGWMESRVVFFFFLFWGASIHHMHAAHHHFKKRAAPPPTTTLATRICRSCQKQQQDTQRPSAHLCTCRQHSRPASIHPCIHPANAAW